MTNLIDPFEKNIIQMGPNSVPTELVKNIACVSQEISKMRKRIPHMPYSKLLKQT